MTDPSVPPATPSNTPQRVLVVLPTWVGDLAMASPTLRALRGLYPEAHITLLAKGYAGPAMIDAMPWHDRLMVMGQPGSSDEAGGGGGSLIARLRRQRFDLAVLLTNSFRSALIARLGGARRVVGYARDHRSWLLTDRLRPPRAGGRFTPVPTLDYYLKLAEHLGAESPDRAPALFTRPEDDERAEAILREAGVAEGEGPLVMLNPGAANHGSAKLWPADRFGALADHLVETRQARVLVNGAPNERPILDKVHAASKHELVDLPSRGSSLTLLKSLVARCDLMVTNDTGPRHIAVAMGTPVVSLFGPTDPRWTLLGSDLERMLNARDEGDATVDADTPPDAMTRLSVRQVCRAVDQTLDAFPSEPDAGGDP
ncbi:MAG: lipopolysaccharide heptosyltransferase II [Planctomycetota bacterium]|jgi:heptosyltransferase-2